MDTLYNENANIELLTGVVLWVEKEERKPEEEREWDQEEWGTVKECGTAYCVAGKIAVDTGWHPTVEYNIRRSGNTMLNAKEYVFGRMSREPDTKYDRYDHDQVSTEAIARDALGLEDWEARELFRSFNTAQEVRDIAEEIAGKPLAQLPAEQDLRLFERSE